MKWGMARTSLLSLGDFLVKGNGIGNGPEILGGITQRPTSSALISHSRVKRSSSWTYAAQLERNNGKCFE